MRWLLWRAGAQMTTQAMVSTEKMPFRECELQLRAGRPESAPVIDFRVTDKVGDRGRGLIEGSKNRIQDYSPIAFSAPLPGVPEAYLVEAYPTQQQRPLHELYSKAVERGRRKDAIGLITEVLPRVANLEILTENDEPILHLVFPDYSVPATLAGDGVQSLLRLSLELAASAGGAVLLEEPEVHQHPAAIRRSARVILAAVRRQVQVVLTTHSLEMINALLAESSKEDLDLLSLYQLRLEDGVIISSRLAGPDVAFSRSEIEDDLR